MPSHKGRLVVLSLLRREGQWICLWDREGWDVVLALLTTENQSNRTKLLLCSCASRCSFGAGSFKRPRTGLATTGGNGEIEKQ